MALLCAEVFAGNESAVAADNALAMFLLGLAIGVLIGIGLFFGYLVIRERRRAESSDQLDELFEALDAVEDPWALPVENRFQFERDIESREPEEEPIESLEPWERPADWWRNRDD